MKTQSVVLLAILAISALSLVAVPAFAEDGAALPVTSAVEAAAITGIVAGALVKAADSWNNTPNSQDYEKRHYGALGLTFMFAIAVGVGAYGLINIPANPSTLLAIFAVNFPTGLGLQWGASRTLKGFSAAPATGSGPAP